MLLLQETAQSSSILISKVLMQQAVCSKCTCLSPFSSCIILIQICKILIDLSLSYLGAIYLTIVFHSSCFHWEIKFPSLSPSCIIWFSAAHFILNSRKNVSLLYQNLRHIFAVFLPNKLNYNNKTFNHVSQNRKSEVLILFGFFSHWRNPGKKYQCLSIHKSSLNFRIIP